MTQVQFIDHNETDVLLWLTEPVEPNSTNGSFTTTVQLWHKCIVKLERKGYVERAGDQPNEIKVTAKGNAHAAEIRANG